MVSLIIVSKYIHVNCTIPLSIAGGPMIGGEMGPSYSQHDPVSDTNVHPGMLHCHDKVKSTIVKKTNFPGRKVNVVNKARVKP